MEVQFYQNKNALYCASSMIQDDHPSAHLTPRWGVGWARDGRIYEMYFYHTDCF
jgi:hypothetical protein